jgi:hypothetical protein
MIIEPVLGLDTAQPSVDAPLGSTPNSDNYIFREGAMEPRPMLSLRNQTPQPLGNNVIAGAYELVSVTNVRTPLASGTTQWAVYGQSGTPNGWSVLSYVSSYGLNDPPSLAAGTDYWDFAQTYYGLGDQNVAIGAAGSYQTLYVTKSDATIFSSLTGAPRAKYVASLDNYVMAFNMKDGNGTYVQRVMWSDRGSMTSWIPGVGLAGFEDLLSMKGAGTRIIGQDNRVLLFSDQEIWQGVEGTFPFIWSFAPYDTSRGCPYSMTIVNTPIGTMFLGKDYEIYLLPKSGGQTRPIGQALHRTIRNTIDNPSRAWAIYDNTYSQYQLYYPIKGGSGYPQRAVYLQLGPAGFSAMAQYQGAEAGSWAPQSFDRAGGQLSITRGAEIYVSSSATTWGGLQAAGVKWSDLGMSWAELQGTSEARAIMMGSSNGSLYYMNSNATSDNGTAVECRWQSTGMGGEDMRTQKTVTEWRVGYQSDSASSLTVRFSPNLGASFGPNLQVNLPAVSGISEAIAFPYMAARYPCFEVTSQGGRHRLFRFGTYFNRGGR